MKRVKWYITILMAVLLSPVCLRGQPTMVHGYEFTTGVDSSLWYDMSVSTPWTIASVAAYMLPFSFFMWDRDYSDLYLYRDGSILLTYNGATYLPYDNFPSRDDYGIGIYGYKNSYTALDPNIVPIQTRELGSEGHRVVVIEVKSFAGGTGGGVSNKCQIQLREEDYSITLVYGQREFVSSTPVRIGLQFDSSHVAVVNQNNHTVTTHAMGTAPTSWPGQYRYYRFVPGDSLCPTPRGFSSELVWENDNDIRLQWSSSSLYNTFRVEYGPAGFAEGSGTSMIVSGPPVVIQGIHTTEEMEARVYTQCANGESDYAGTTFTTCPAPTGLLIGSVGLTDDQLRLSWNSLPRYHSYRVEYGPAGFAEGTGTGVAVNDTSLVLAGLPPNEEMEARVYAQCTYGESDFGSILFSTSCLLSEKNKIHYSSLYADSVKCCIGSFGSPATVSSPAHIVDYGSESGYSRHTVHSDTSERDSRTNNLLRTVPEGFCSSVRLGNWRNGGEQESIFYTLDIDTARFDLLILRYALVEQNPNHPAHKQPRFEFDIFDTHGSSISPCYHGNFISGDLSGWNQVGSVVWRDWDAVGVDLTPLHGQTIIVALSNYDCEPGGHYGYAYFTLESGSKRILAESCGDEAANTFRAPEGFSYRWFSAADTATTLSTADTLYVAAAGDYGCHVTYQLSNQMCGFYLSTFAGGRFPVAAFDMKPLDSCRSQVRFANQSVIARDSNRTQLTTFSCDEYRWVVDDSISSSATNPTFSFDEGTHTVTLYAMLAGGACVDSVSQTFTVALQHDTLNVAICENGGYPFFGQWLTEAGVYEHVADCHHTVLYLEVNPVYDTEVYDTFLLGGDYQFDDYHFRQPNVYPVNYTTVEGCDSIVTLYLSCIDMRDTTVCSSSLPMGWYGVTFASAGEDTLRLTSRGGTDSIVVLKLSVLQQPVVSMETEIYCHESGGYLLLLPDTLCYFLASIPADGGLPSDWIRGSQLAEPLLLSPSDTTYYFLTADYCDTLPCPWYDSVLLAPVAAVDARLSVAPSWLDESNLDLTAVDLTPQPHERHWFFNDTPSLDADSMVVYLASTTDDSVLVMLVANTDVCTDTATVTVPVRIQSLWFPNIFTPDEPTNNRFRGYGKNVKDYELKIYTRWGDCFFRTTDINEGWDGTSGGIKSPVSAYVYLCHYTTLDGEARTVSGTVTLVR